MDALMSVGCGALRKIGIAVGCLTLALQMGLAQKRPVAGAPDATRAILVEKAHALESRGRPDMAIQIWQQILLSDPRNTEALAGLAKDLKLIGSTEKSSDALERLRKINPNDPNISKIQALASTRVESDQLRHAGELARQGKPDDAMRIYRELYGDHPPGGDIALAYYQTLHGTASGKESAIAAMRALADRNPGDPRFAVELGIMLTYDPRTRAEGIRILKGHPKDTNAQTALRQALIWDSANPASAAELRQYLKDHPQDTEISSHLKEDEYKLAQMNSGITRTPAERAAFAALNAHKVEEAETRLTAILEQEPGNGRVAAGMGFLRMQQNNFGGAISYLTQAEQNGYKVKAVEDALVTSRFWYTMNEASQAFDENQLDVAAARYHAALAIHPSSPEALNGMAGLLIREQQYTSAAGVYEQLIKVQPGSAQAWRGLFLAYARDGQNQKALAVSARFPEPVKAAMARDPEYLRTLATIYHAQNRNADAQRALALALSLPFPESGTNLKADTKLQYAGILMEAKHYDQAAELYTQILDDDAGNLSAWMGMISAHHELGQDNQAIADVQKMPPATYEAALADSGFLSMLGAIYQQANQFEIAQGLLERSVKLQIAAGGQPGVALQLQLAGIYLQRNNTAQAYVLYHQILGANPDRADAWKGLISTLQATSRNSEALQEIALIPAPVRKQLEADIEFVQSEASLYAALGDNAHAVEYMNRVQAHYSLLKTQPPANIEIQNAWLLFNIRNDRALYPALMQLGSRKDLSVPQREMVQNIWANWSVRRAGAAMDNGNVQRAVDILDAASQAFPDNINVRKAVAGGYGRVGRAKESLSLYKTIPMQDATAGDFQGAVGAALAANDKAQAEIWLRQALDRYPRDPAILSLAARFEQARGDNQRAADFYRASLAAMPTGSPTARLAHELFYPEQDTRARRAVTAADLQHLLDPDYEPFAKTTKLPPLPAYGADPYNGLAPVVLTPAQTAPQQQAPQPTQQDVPAQQSVPGINAPSSNEDQAPSSRLYRQRSGTQAVAGRAGSSKPGYTGSSTGSSMRSASSQANSVGGLPLPSGTVAEPSQQASAGMPKATLGQIQSQANGQPVQLSADAPHSLASDAYKGLVFSLMANNRNAEALQEIAKIPPDVRKQLEADVEFEQGEASLYVALGDIPHANEYLNRVENFYLLRRTAVPAGMEVQHAWLLYNTGNDSRLYPLLLRLDIRQDLNPAQREEVENLWANWAVRRAFTAMNNGNLLRGVMILQAASQDYPDNMNVRRAVAGAYAKVGRATDSLALFKTIPMQDASSGDFQGAIGAALAAPDMAQAEAWLRQALERYPRDPQILGLAARFEQARGNNQRAADFWRASLAAMPPGATAQKLNSGLVYPPGTYKAPAPGDLKRLLDPRNDPPQKTTKLPPLPAYPDSYNRTASGASAPQQSRTQSSRPQSSQRVDTPSEHPLPLPPPPASNPGTVPNAQGPAPGSAPIYIPQSATQGGLPSQPVLIEQSATRGADIKPAPNTTQAGKPAHTASHTSSKIAAKPRAAPNQSSYTGKMHLPPSEENINSTDTVSGGTAPRNPLQAPAWTPQASGVQAGSNPVGGLRIASQPMDNMAAQAQALFADQTDGQLTQGSATQIRAIPNASVRGAAQPSPGPYGSTTPGSAQYTQYQDAQYTPSAQEAATGAYSAPKQQTPQPQTQQPAQQAAAPPPATSTKKLKKKTATSTSSQQPAPTPTLGNTPAAPQDQQQVQIPAELPATPPPANSGAGLSDEELQQRDLPPLRGPWVRVQREARAVSPRDEAEMQLRAIESGYSPWLGGAGILNYRSGALGYDHLAALEAPFEVSMPLGYNARLTIIAKPVFLDSGQADGTSTLTVLEAASPGAPLSLTTIPQPIGTDINTSGAATTTAGGIPPQQNAVGIGGEVQLAFPHLALAGGYTPAGFLVSTFTARGTWKPGNGPFTFSVNRDSVKDTQLSYSGLRDPSGTTLGNLGQAWGGVMANQGNVQFVRGDAESGFYFGAGGQYLAGYKVEINTRVEGSGGAYWRLKTMPEYGNLSIGANFFGMHYAHNEDAFTFGMGGYFSPQAYFLANVPFTWAGHYQTHWHYNILGSLGVQAFQEDQTPLFPLAAQAASEIALNSAALPAKTSVGPNYDIHGQVAYQIGPHWFAGGFFSANNTRNYNAVSAGFSIHYMFRAQPSTATTPTGLFPTDGTRPNDVMRPFTVP
jgi:tetratricopeptide (TPR) repeat protein